MIDDALATELAAIAGELATSQVDSWAEVLDNCDGPNSTVESALVRSTLGAPGTLARQLLTAWQNHGRKLPGSALALALRAAGQIHAEAERQRSSLVVSGPFDFSAPTRFTRSAALEVVANATRSLLIVSFATHGMEELIDELLTAANRGVTIDFVLESLTKDGGTLRNARHNTGEFVFAPLRRLSRSSWNFGGGPVIVKLR